MLGPELNARVARCCASVAAERHRPAVRFFFLWLLYLVAMLGTMAIPFADASLTPVWIPTGVALFCMIWWSPRYWPAVLLAGLSLDAHITFGNALEALVNALEPAFGAYLYLRVFKHRERLGELSGIVGMLGLGGIVAPTIAAVLMQKLSGIALLNITTPESYDWRLWISGDLSSVLLVTPLLVSLATRQYEGEQWTSQHTFECMCALLLLIVTGGLVFEMWERRWPVLDMGTETMADAFLLFPILTWIALRFSPPIANAALMLSAALATWQTCHGFGPFSQSKYEVNVMWLHGFIAIGGVFTTLISVSKHESDRNQRDLRHSRQKYRLLFRNNPHPMWLCDAETFRFLEVNDSALQKYGYSREEFLAMTVRDIRSKDELFELEKHLEQVKTKRRDVSVWKHRKKDGTPLDVEITACGFEVDGQRRRLILANDVTEKRQLEAELRQAQKLEALGRLAGGVAHDFNNIIMIISSYAERLQFSAQNPERVQRDSERILQAADRAAGITKELLAFGRKQVLMPCVLDLNSVVSNILPMLQRLVGEDVDFSWRAGQEVCPVKLDVGQLTQVLLNLCANARDAMNGSGSLSITTGEYQSDGIHQETEREMPAGMYAVLTVADDGAGMSPAVRERIFEPFFTTKGTGKGTGLGLATVYGIVKQSGGFISVISELGIGTEFRLYFPSAAEKAVASPVRASTILEHGNESVLVVEDEDELRSAVVESLRSLGYRVKHARDGRHALQVADELGTVDLLVTDVVMPAMRGTEMAKYLRRMFPALKIIFMSGYADGLVKPEELDDKTIFLAKPLSLSALAKNIRQLLVAPVVSSQAQFSGVIRDEGSSRSPFAELNP
jgi:two-component system, cell cycle sensor histidine kinase and response regulator CckA